MVHLDSAAESPVETATEEDPQELVKRLSEEVTFRARVVRKWMQAHPEDPWEAELGMEPPPWNPDGQDGPASK